MGLDKAQLQLAKPRERGQAMVEFGLVIFFIFILFVTVLQMILLMHAYNTVANAAKEGVRYAIVHGTGNVGGVNATTLGGQNLDGCSGPGNSIVSPAITCPDGTAPYRRVQQAVVDFAAVSFQTIALNDVQVDYDPNQANTGSIYAGPCSGPGCMVKVTVTHTYVAFLPWLKFHLDAAASGRIMN